MSQEKKMNEDGKEAGRFMSKGNDCRQGTEGSKCEVLREVEDMWLK